MKQYVASGSKNMPIVRADVEPVVKSGWKVSNGRVDALSAGNHYLHRRPILKFPET